MTNNEQDFEVCLRAENVILPKYGHFGVSAATGGLAGILSVCQSMQKQLFQQKLCGCYYTALEQIKSYVSVPFYFQSSV
jgi:hypothetical protein